MSSFNSGIAEISLKTRKILNSLNTSIEEFGPAGIIEAITIIVSNRFQPSLKKCNFLFSAKNRIEISTTKKRVINTSKA